MGLYNGTKKGLEWLAKKNFINDMGEANIPKILEAIESGKLKECPPGFVPTSAQLSENPMMARLLKM